MQPDGSLPANSEYPCFRTNRHVTKSDRLPVSDCAFATGNGDSARPDILPGIRRGGLRRPIQ